MSKRIHGITIMPEYIQSEGVTAILDWCEQAGIKQIATAPYYMTPEEDGVGYREPPIDAGSGKVRLLDKPLWGKYELWFTVKPSFKPNMAHYAGLRYQPMPCDTKPDALLHQLTEHAAARGIEVYFQIMTAIPPALRVQNGNPLPEDLPLLPDGSPLHHPLARNGSLASAEVLAYAQALSRDLLEQYPQLTGIRFDWPEYPCYHIDSVFTDFNPQVRPFAEKAGYDYSAIQSAVAALYERLHDMTDEDLVADHLFDLSDQPERIEQWLRLKSDLVTAFNRSLCETVHAFDRKAILHAFPPPFATMTGFDFAANHAFADGIGMKLYTMHLPMILNHYGTQLLAWNPQLDEARLVEALNRWLDLGDTPLATLADYSYPPPDKSHQISHSAQIRKIQDAVAQSDKVHTMVHTYGPLDDFSARLDLSFEETPNGIWLNRYCYLDDAKEAQVLTKKDDS